jgi:hypothetical protein
MRYYKIKCENHTFLASVEETNDMYRLKFGGIKACVYLSVYKDEKEYPNLDALGYGKECDRDSSLPKKEGTIILLQASLKFLVWLFPFIRHVQFSDASNITCAKGVTIPLATFHFAKYGKTWYQDKFSAKPLDKTVPAMFKKVNNVLEKQYNQTFEKFFKQHVRKHLVNMKGIKTDHLYEMLETCWNEADNYKAFFRNIGARDCILLQLWLDEYIKFLLGLSSNALLYWKIKRNTIDLYSCDVVIRETRTAPKFIAKGGSISEDLYDMNDFLKGRRYLHTKTNILSGVH